MKYLSSPLVVIIIYLLLLAEPPAHFCCCLPPPPLLPWFRSWRRRAEAVATLLVARASLL